MSLRDASRKSFGLRKDIPDKDELMLGCAQRIADATELMAKDRAQLERNRDFWKGHATYWEREAKAARASRNALRGVITRLKRRIARLEEEA